MYATSSLPSQIKKYYATRPVSDADVEGVYNGQTEHDGKRCESIQIEWKNDTGDLWVWAETGNPNFPRSWLLIDKGFSLSDDPEPDYTEPFSNSGQKPLKEPHYQTIAPRTNYVKYANRPSPHYLQPGSRQPCRTETRGGRPRNDASVTG